MCESLDFVNYFVFIQFKEGLAKQMARENIENRSERSKKSFHFIPSSSQSLGSRGFFLTQILIVWDETANGSLIKPWATEFYFILCISRTDRWIQGSLSSLSLSFHIAISMVYSFIVRRESLEFPDYCFLFKHSVTQVTV